MGLTSAQCALCGGAFRGSETSCTYCHAVRPALVDDVRVRHAVEAALREDRNRNGIPDVLEPRPTPNVVFRLAPPEPARGNASAGVAWLAMGMAMVVLLGVVGAVFFLRAARPTPPPRATPAPWPTAVTTPATADPTTSALPVPTLPPPSVTSRPAMHSAPKPTPVPAPVPTETAPPGKTEPAACVALRAARAKNNPASTLSALEAQCRMQGGQPDPIGF